jgi:hypothetical protein
MPNPQTLVVDHGLRALWVWTGGIGHVQRPSGVPPTADVSPRFGELRSGPIPVVGNCNVIAGCSRLLVIAVEPTYKREASG